MWSVTSLMHIYLGAKLSTWKVEKYLQQASKLNIPEVLHQLVQCVLRQLQRQNMGMLPDALFDVKDSRAFEMQTARISAQQQPRRTKLPPLIPQAFAVGVFYIICAADIACPLQSKLQSQQLAYTKTGEQVSIPAHARFLRRTACTSPFSTTGGVKVGDDCFEVAFGSPWNFENFLTKATELGHPAFFL